MDSKAETDVAIQYAGQSEKGSGENKLSKAPNVGFGYIERTPGSAGWNTSLLYELPRSFKSDSSKVSALVGDLGANYSIDRNFYFGSGLNIARPFYTNDAGLLKEKLGVGFQLLTGYQNESGLGVELSYRVINYKASAKVEDLTLQTSQQFSGINLGLNYLF